MAELKKNCLAIVALMSLCAWADTWTDPDTGYTWTYRINGDTAEILNEIDHGDFSGFGAAISPAPVGAVMIPSTLGGKPVTRIGKSAFLSCSGLTSVTFPDSVASIGEFAFFSCSGLTGVTFPDSVASIGEGAFNSCSGLTSVTIPNGVTNIEAEVFCRCSGLASVTIPTSVTSIGNEAFESCRNLTNVAIPAGVTNIGNWVFEDCVALASVTIPSSVACIGEDAFNRCSCLTTVHVATDDTDRVKSLLSASGYDISGITFVEDIVPIPDPVTPDPGAVPGNDNFVDAFDFGDTSTLTCDNTGATTEAGEPLTNRWEQATTTVWWKWVAPEDGTAIFDTVGSSFDTVMGVYVGESLANLSVVAEDDDGGGTGATSEVTFLATSGTTYYVCVAGWGGAAGNITLNCGFSSAANPLPPPSVTSLSATEDGPGVIRVSWGIPSGAAVSGYKVYRATRSDFTRASLVAELSDRLSLSYDATDVSVDPTYYYWVVAVNDMGESEAAGPAIGYCEEPLQIATTTLPAATELVAYEETLQAELDTGYLYWYVESGGYGNTGLPEGFVLSSDGVLSGTSTQAGAYSFTVVCMDTRFNVSTSMLLTLVINGNQNSRPSVSASEPADGSDIVLTGGGSQRFSVTASDPEGVSLTYRWVVDGVEVQSGTKNWYRLRTDSEDAGASHAVTCYVNDDLWIDVVGQSWNVYVTKEIYVDVVNGDDDVNDGASAGSAYASLWKAIDNSSPYDTIHVAPGVYGQVYAWCPVSVVATGGPQDTIIEGDEWGACVEYQDGGYSGRMSLHGFTLRNGKLAAHDVMLEQCMIVKCGPTEVEEWEDDDGILDKCSLIRCTVVGNRASWARRLMTDSNCSSDTLVWGNNDAVDSIVDPMFVDSRNGDYRLRAASPYVENGVATKGAIDEVVFGYVISASVEGPGMLDKMTAIVEGGEAVTFTATADVFHPLDHFEVNGEPVESSGGSYTFSNVMADATLKAVFVSNLTFYVDAVNGSDAADGLARDTAVATLQEAIDRAADGDTVVVADGVYEPIDTNAKRITIESENGYGTTVIDGGGTNRCVDVGYVGQFFFDLSVSTDTVLRGFTLTNGRAYRGGGVFGGTVENCLIIGNTAYTEEPGYGAAYVYGEGGGAYGSILRHCTVVGNVAEFWPGNEWEADPYTCGGEGGGAYGCTLENCIVWKNEGEVSDDEYNSVWSSDNCVGEDPAFVDFENGDYRLLASSWWVVGGVAMVGCESEAVFTDRPDTPGWEFVSQGITTDGVHLSWLGEGTQAVSWDIYRSSTSDYDWMASPIAQVTDTSYIDTTAERGVHYWYWLEARNKKGRSDESELAEGWCVTKENLPKPYEANSPYHGEFLEWLQDYELAEMVNELSENELVTVATNSARKGHPLWHDFVAGTDPTVPDDEFKVFISFTNGVPCIAWTPDFSGWRDYTIMAKERLEDKEWKPWDMVIDARFFKVEVSLPEGVPEPRPYWGMTL